MRRLSIGFLLVASIGCHRGGSSPAPASIDYRKLSQAELVALIKDKLRVESVTLSPDGPNRHKGTMPSPDGTIQLPVEVTVEAERIVLTTKGGGLTTRQVITPRGLETDLR
jgi:WD40 repeat protein